jgi:branched-chain amino acid transport system ATP-binding protein
MILDVQGITKKFGGLVALDNVTLSVDRGSIQGIIGPNGAGKTTLMNVIAGTYGPEGGHVSFRGEDITDWNADRICRAGVARTFQISQPFPKLTVLENVMVGATFGNVVPQRYRLALAREALAFTDFPLSEDTLAQDLNAGQLKRLDLARALATGPDLLLVDEIAAGLTPGEVGEMADLLLRVRDLDITLIVVEHLMPLITKVCDRVAVLSYGVLIADGPCGEVMRDPKVADAYLGEEYQAASESDLPGTEVIHAPQVMAARLSEEHRTVPASVATSRAVGNTMLKVENLQSRYEHLQVLFDVSLNAAEGEFVALLGPNGAGKTTTLKTIIGLVQPWGGLVTFDGQRIDGMSEDRISRLGLSYIPEDLHLFPQMTVYENLLLGSYCQKDEREINRTLDFVFDLFPILAERRKQAAGTLSGGERKMLAIGRGLMSNPKLLMVDEPSLGLAPILVEAVFEALVRLNESGLTILLVEQNLRKSLQITDRAYVLEQGQITLSGLSTELVKSEYVTEAYLGIEHKTASEGSD